MRLAHRDIAGSPGPQWRITEGGRHSAAQVAVLRVVFGKARTLAASDRIFHAA
jgi:hypothetical protein